jgi:hypothetical protein
MVMHHSRGKKTQTTSVPRARATTAQLCTPSPQRVLHRRRFGSSTYFIQCTNVWWRSPRKSCTHSGMVTPFVVMCSWRVCL